MDLSKAEVYHMVEIIQLRYATERCAMESHEKGEYIDFDKLSDKDLAKYAVIIED